MDNLFIPPHNIEAEQSVIGSILKDNSVFDDLELTEKEFYSRSHRLIYSAISELFNKNSPVDLLTVTDLLENKKQIEDVGGFVYVAECVKNTPSSSNAKAYSKIIRENFVKRAILESVNSIQESIYNSGDDAKDICLFAENKIGEISDIFSSRTTNKTMNEIAQEFVNEIERRAESGKTILGVSTGLTDLDDKISGLIPSDLIILAARPSMGKTTLSLNMVEEEALNGGYPLVFSLEMPAEQLFMKMVASVGGVEFNKLKHANLDNDDWNRIALATHRLNESNLEINDNSTMTLQDIRLSTREYKKKHRNVSLIMVDYLQLISGKGENRTQEISAISRGLKALAKEFKCPVLALSQLNRGLETRSNKRPVNADLRESGQIEQDADVIMFIYRDEVYNPDTQDKGLAEIIIGKARNGTLGMVGSVFDGAKSKFRNLSGQTIMGEVEDSSSMFD